ncbi:OmpL47-type beta-barrel domain-containing protein, partial [Bacillus subtilis]|uniref:OmpL47-type beta-barrel domain-containing protein n=1 Tax=Bacillus subtilis TaxID=1423 RepID=UPI003F7C3B6B
TKDNVIATLTSGTDAQSGVSRTEYKIGSGAWQTYVSPITISTEGEITSYARTVDNAGNISPEVTLVTKIDRTGPLKPTPTITPTGEWSKETVTISLTPGVDAGVGTDKTQYKLDNGSWEDYLGPVVLEAEGVYEFEAVSIDRLGNRGSELKQTIRIDKTVPSRPEVILSNNEWTNQDVTMYATHGSDTGSGADYTEYSRDGTNWTKYIAPVVVKDSGEWTYLVYTVDKSGNKGESSQVTVKVDKIAPTAPELALSSNVPTQDSVLITLTDGEDDLSGVD